MSINLMFTQTKQRFYLAKQIVYTAMLVTAKCLILNEKLQFKMLKIYMKMHEMFH